MYLTAHAAQYQKKPNQKMGRRPKQTYLQRRHMYIQNAHEKMISILIIKDKRIKTTMTYHLPLIRMAIIKISTNKKCWRGCGEKGTILHCGWECKLLTATMENSMEVS